MAYIHREKFLKKCAEAFGSFGILIKAIEEISNESISADVVEVVRCKDCKYWQDNNDRYPHEECRWGNGETPDAE